MSCPPIHWKDLRGHVPLYACLGDPKDMIPSVNADNTTSGCFAEVDLAGSTTSALKIRTYVGTTLTDSGVFFTMRRYRS